MLHSWTASPLKRPTFEDLSERLRKLLEETTEEYGYLEFNGMADVSMINGIPSSDIGQTELVPEEEQSNIFGIEAGSRHETVGVDPCELGNESLPRQIGVSVPDQRNEDVSKVIESESVSGEQKGEGVLQECENQKNEEVPEEGENESVPGEQKSEGVLQECENESVTV